MKRDPLDLDVEQFNPEVSRARYTKLGYSPEHINKLCQMDALIYACPVEEIREAVEADRDGD
jgi:hypothetical protein